MSSSGRGPLSSPGQSPSPAPGSGGFASPLPQGGDDHSIVPSDIEDMPPSGGNNAQGGPPPRANRRANREPRPRPDAPAQKQDPIAQEVESEFVTFLTNFTTMDRNDEKTFNPDDPQCFDYLRQMATLEESEKTTVTVDLDHLEAWGEGALAAVIMEEYYRFEPAMQRAVQRIMEQRHRRYARQDEHIYNPLKDFYVSISNHNDHSTVRDLKTERLGALMSVEGTVTRTTEVRPELRQGTFKCVECGAMARGIHQQFKYTEPLVCGDRYCDNRRMWDLDVQASKFCDWQRVRVQENATEIPAGNMPRHVEVILRNDAVEKAKPGDRCVFTGCLIVVPDVAQLTGDLESVRTDKSRVNPNYEGFTGLKQLGVRSLNYKLVFLANNVTLSHVGFGMHEVRSNETDEEVVNSMAPEEKEELYKMKADAGNFYEEMAKAICPTVHGHPDIKKGILCMLLGGVHKETSEKMALRGDINVCIVGDPSTAKSQFLKYVCSIMPRTVFTSGRSSTAAGLTASVAKDPETGEFQIEAGALMLADNGICCIDEFDKMDPKDQAAIHEAMEQQTISITKAGISASLNARTSILAAANPIFGRYDRSRPLQQNVDISPPIMSRFDLFFIVVDEMQEQVDTDIAKHIVALHQGKVEDLQVSYSMDFMRRYIRFARSFKPRFTKAAYETAVRHYVEIRQNDTSHGSKSAYRITVRQLESMIRLSEALARLHLDEEVKPQYVDEAASLLQKSIIPVEGDSDFMNELNDGMEADEELKADDEKDDGPGGGGGGGGGSDDGGPPPPGGGAGGSNGHMPSSSNGDGHSGDGVKRKMTFQLYMRYTLMMARYVRSLEAKFMSEARVRQHSQQQQQQQRQQRGKRKKKAGDDPAEVGEWGGIKEIDLLNWFCAEQAKAKVITNREELSQMMKVLRFVVRRLVDLDRVFLEHMPAPEGAKQQDERTLVVHPDFDVDTPAITAGRSSGSGSSGNTTQPKSSSQSQTQSQTQTPDDEDESDETQRSSSQRSPQEEEQHLRDIVESGEKSASSKRSKTGKKGSKRRRKSAESDDSSVTSTNNAADKESARKTRASARAREASGTTEPALPPTGRPSRKKAPRKD